jgi:hypothetical protein
MYGPILSPSNEIADELARIVTSGKKPTTHRRQSSLVAQLLINIRRRISISAPETITSKLA